MHYPCQWRNETELEAYSCLRHPWSLELTHASSSNKLVSCSALVKERHSTCKEQHVEFPHTNDPVGTLECCNQGTHTCVSSACLITPHLLLLTNLNIHAITRIQFVKLPHLPTAHPLWQSTNWPRQVCTPKRLLQVPVRPPLLFHFLQCHSGLAPSRNVHMCPCHSMTRAGSWYCK